MNMDLDKDDLAALCAGLTTDEVDRVLRSTLTRRSAPGVLRLGFGA